MLSNPSVVEQDFMVERPNIGKDVVNIDDGELAYVEYDARMQNASGHRRE